MSEQTEGLPSSRSPDPEEGRVERERAWATAIANGDESAFESVYLAYYDSLHLFAQRFVRSPDVAEELIGTVFLRLWERSCPYETAITPGISPRRRSRGWASSTPST